VIDTDSCTSPFCSRNPDLISVVTTEGTALDVREPASLEYTGDDVPFGEHHLDD
jgi:hypothetical protein